MLACISSGFHYLKALIPEMQHHEREVIKIQEMASSWHGFIFPLVPERSHLSLCHPCDLIHFLALQVGFWFEGLCLPG